MCVCVCVCVCVCLSVPIHMTASLNWRPASLTPHSPLTDRRSPFGLPERRINPDLAATAASRAAALAAAPRPSSTTKQGVVRSERMAEAKEAVVPMARDMPRNPAAAAAASALSMPTPHSAPMTDLPKPKTSAAVAQIRQLDDKIFSIQEMHAVLDNIALDDLAPRSPAHERAEVQSATVELKKMRKQALASVPASLLKQSLPSPVAMQAQAAEPTGAFSQGGGGAPLMRVPQQFIQTRSFASGAPSLALQTAVSEPAAAMPDPRAAFCGFTVDSRVFPAAPLAPSFAFGAPPPPPPVMLGCIPPLPPPPPPGMFGAPSPASFANVAPQRPAPAMGFRATQTGPSDALSAMSAPTPKAAPALVESVGFRGAMPLSRSRTAATATPDRPSVQYLEKLDSIRSRAAPAPLPRFEEEMASRDLFLPMCSGGAPPTARQGMVRKSMSRSTRSSDREESSRSDERSDSRRMEAACLALHDESLADSDIRGGRGRGRGRERGLGRAEIGPGSGRDRDRQAPYVAVALSRTLAAPRGRLASDDEEESRARCSDAAVYSPPLAQLAAAVVADGWQSAAGQEALHGSLLLGVATAVGLIRPVPRNLAGDPQAAEFVMGSLTRRQQRGYLQIVVGLRPEVQHSVLIREIEIPFSSARPRVRTSVLGVSVCVCVCVCFVRLSSITL
jgi:hypothetical protein